MPFEIKGVLGDPEAINSLKDDILQEEMAKFKSEQSSTSSSSTSGSTPLSTLANETLLSKIRERHFSRGANRKLLFRKQANIDDEEDGFKCLAKNIYRGKIGWKRRYVYTYVEYQGQLHIYILLDLTNHKYETSKYAEKDFNLHNYFSSEETKENIKKQLEPILTTDSITTTTSSTIEKDFNINIIDTQFFNNQLIKLTDKQKKALATPTPCIIDGSAGSGKTVISDGALAYESYLAKYPTYVTQNRQLLNERRADYNKNHPDSPANFCTYEDMLLAEEQLKPASERRQLISKEEYLKWIKDDLKKTNQNGIQLSDEDILEEFRILCGYDEAEYLKLGVKRSNFGGKEENKQVIRAALWKSYTRLQQFLAANRLMHPDFTSLPVNKYPTLIIDEAQDFSLLQLKSLYYAAINRNIRFLYDSNQTLMDHMWRKDDYLFQLAKKHGGVINASTLDENLRCSVPVTNLGNQALDIINYLYREGKNSDITGNAEKSGAIQWLQAKSDSKKEIHDLLEASYDTAVITLSEFIDDAKKEFGDKVNVYTVEDIKGMEYKNIILYRFFDGKKQDPLLKDVTELLANGIKPKKDKEDKCHPYWKNLYTAITRAQESVIVYQDFKARKNAYEPLYTKLRYDRVTQSVTPITEHLDMSKVNITPKDADSCLDLVVKLIERANKEEDKHKADNFYNRAVSYYKEYLAFENRKLNDAEFNIEFNNYKNELLQLNTTISSAHSNITTQSTKTTATKTKGQKNRERLKRKKGKVNEFLQQLDYLLENDNTTIALAKEAGHLPNVNIIEGNWLTLNSHPEKIAPKKTPQDNLLFLLENFSENNLDKLFSLGSEACLKTLFNGNVNFNNANQHLISHIQRDTNLWNIFIKYLEGKYYKTKVLFPDNWKNQPTHIHDGLWALAGKLYLSSLILKNTMGTPPLIKAAENGLIGIVKMLIESGSDPNVKDNNNDTALHLAAKNGHTTVVRELLKYDIDMNENKQGKTPVLLAIDANKVEVIQLMSDEITSLQKLLDNFTEESVKQIFRFKDRTYLGVLFGYEFFYNKTKQILFNHIFNSETFSQIFINHLDGLARGINHITNNIDLKYVNTQNRFLMILDMMSNSSIDKEMVIYLWKEYAQQVTIENQLTFAINSKHTDIIKILIRNDEYLSFRLYNTSLFSAAAYAGLEDVVREFIHKHEKRYLDIRCKKGMIELAENLLIKNFSIPYLKLLLDLGNDIFVEVLFNHKISYDSKTQHAYAHIYGDPCPINRLIFEVFINDPLQKVLKDLIQEKLNASSSSNPNGFFYHPKSNVDDCSSTASPVLKNNSPASF